VELSLFDQFAPWFAAESISQLQLAQLGFKPESGVEMYFMDKARNDGKSVAGLETVHDQISLFSNMSMDTQAEYLLSSLKQAQDLPKDVDAMVRAWQRGDTRWFAAQLQSEFGRDARVYDSLLGAATASGCRKSEVLLNDDRNCLVIVGTGHLVRARQRHRSSEKDGIGVSQR
jgi:uncharacterized protein YbaP (TraB family)